jgi:putative flippase GtrA
MSIVRQGRHYVLIGGLQWLVDWGVMVLVSHLGAMVEIANICGRISGAMLGFWLNGKITFAADDTTVGRRQLQRFVLMWLCNTAVSTFAVGRIDEVFGLQWAWVAKPAIELTLGMVGFLLSRYWVYRA